MYHPLNTLKNPSVGTHGGCITSSVIPAPFMLLQHCCGEGGLGIAVGNNTMSMLLLQLKMNKHNKKLQLIVVRGQA